MRDQKAFMEIVDIHMSGRVDEAVKRYRRMLEDDPDEPDILHLLGVAVGQKGKFREALKLIIKAINLQPGVPPFYQNLAATYENLKDYKTAGEVYNKLGNALQDRREYEPAIAAYDKALVYLPGDAEKLSNRAAALNSLGRYEEALEWLNQALTHNPTLAGALTNKGNALLALGRVEEALATHRESLKDEKNFLDGHINLGNALGALGRNDEALEAYEKALALDPDSGLTHWNRALLFLLLGRFEEGWREYEWRWKWAGYLEAVRNFPEPEWKGEPPESLDGPLLILAEQGYGDIIQFARYLPRLAARGYKIIFETQPMVAKLLEEGLPSNGIRILPRAPLLGSKIDDPQNPEDSVKFAAWIGMFSLPFLLGPGSDAIPNEVPYLTVSEEKKAAWAIRLAGKSRRKVGLVWAGRAEHAKDRHRSIKPELFAPLLDREADFYSLQKNGQQWPEPRITNLAPDLYDFTDTAAAILSLDLVITVDTSVAHLAGALGRPVWVLLPLIPDWRWQLSGDSSAWYPTMRLFRQETDGDWADVITRVRTALAA